MSEAKLKIFIVEDDLEIGEMLNAYFRVQGYEVLIVKWGEKVVNACQTSHPDLIILDICHPDVDGYEMTRRLRAGRHTANIPIIYLAEKRDRSDRLQGLELGANDFITKPFHVQELRLRVRNALRRAGQDSLTNPITGLPDGKMVDAQLNVCLQKPEWTMLILSLVNLDEFREMYGFVASDDVLRAVISIFHNAIREIGSAEDFLGHLDSADFVLITGQEKAASLQERICTRLEQSLDYFYPIKDREQSPSRSKRLAFKAGILHSSDDLFTSLDILKSSILRLKQ